MKDKIENLMEKECDYIEFHLKNGSTLSIKEPNKGRNQLTLEEGFLIWEQSNEDGCTYEHYIDIDEISFVSSIYDCPQLLEGEEDA